MSTVDLRNSEVLVTGGAGFIGSRLAEKLVYESGAHVRVLDSGISHDSRITCLPVQVFL